MKRKNSKNQKAYLILIMILFIIIFGYAAYSLTLKDELSAQFVFAKYFFTPSFHAKIDFRPDYIETIEDDSIELIKKCGNPIASDSFNKCLKEQTDLFNSKYSSSDPSYIWRYGSNCNSGPINFDDRKAVFCVTISKQFFLENKAGSWVKRSPVFNFALDFSEYAHKIAEGEKINGCPDGAPPNVELVLPDYCSTKQAGLFCSVDANDLNKYKLVEDCRGFDKLSPHDDCGCPPKQRCGNAGKCISVTS